jgi:hypothetical protein
MPEFTYAGPGGRAYTELRDEDGVITGLVEPGDTRNLAEAPDQFWLPADEKDAKPAAAGSSKDKGGK